MKRKKEAGIWTKCPYCGQIAELLEQDELGRKIYYCPNCDIDFEE